MSRTATSAEPASPVDVDVLREEIRKTYTDVSIDQEHEFIFPTGRALGARARLPRARAGARPRRDRRELRRRRQPLDLGRIEPGEEVLDLGCGAGTDLLIAAQMPGRAAARSAST